MLLLMLFSSLVLARPRLSAPASLASCGPPPVATPPTPLCCLTMLDQVVYRSVILASSSRKL